MKLIIIALTCFLSIIASQQKGKLDLISQKWRQIGLKSFGRDYKPIDKSISESITINKDGTFEQDVYGTIHFKGQWKFNNDSSKIAFEITEMNGVTTHDLSLADKNPIDSIIKLTKDTLIYGSLGFYGQQRIYGHDDWYFVREK